MSSCIFHLLLVGEYPRQPSSLQSDTYSLSGPFQKRSTHPGSKSHRTQCLHMESCDLIWESSPGNEEPRQSEKARCHCFYQSSCFRCKISPQLPEGNKPETPSCVEPQANRPEAQARSGLLLGVLLGRGVRYDVIPSTVLGFPNTKYGVFICWAVITEYFSLGCKSRMEFPHIWRPEAKDQVWPGLLLP